MDFVLLAVTRWDSFSVAIISDDVIDVYPSIQRTELAGVIIIIDEKIPEILSCKDEDTTTLFAFVPIMEASSYKLYTPQGSFRAFAPLIAAEYSRISVEVLTDGIEEAVRSKSPTGKAPFLENIKTGDIIFSSHAMARYLGGARKDSGLMGRNFNETASVNRWVDWCQQDVELPCCILFYPVAGYMPRSEEA